MRLLPNKLQLCCITLLKIFLACGFKNIEAFLWPTDDNVDAALVTCVRHSSTGPI